MRSGKFGIDTCRIDLRGDAKLSIQYEHVNCAADYISVCPRIPNVSYCVRKMPLPFRVITVSKGYEKKSARGRRLWDLFKHVNVNPSSSVFC